MKKIQWGIIGCGDVTELKSGPAFNKVKNSSLVAVMRRDAAKAEDYARRHKVPKWYADASQLINDPEIHAIYIATPPSTHELYTLEAIRAGKPVYVEKPMSLNYTEALTMADAASKNNVKLTVAHYRRQMPLFKKIKERQYEGETWKQIVDEMVNHLPNKVYISFDVDGLDRKYCPNTGTPVQGGFETEEVFYLIKKVHESGRNIIGFDLVEIGVGQTDWDSNVGSRILWRLCNMLVKNNS